MVDTTLEGDTNQIDDANVYVTISSNRYTADIDKATGRYRITVPDAALMTLTLPADITVVIENDDGDKKQITGKIELKEVAEPSSVSFTPTSPTAGTLDWVPPVNTDKIKGYEVKREGATVSIANTTTLELTGLSAGVPETMEVKSIRVDDARSEAAATAQAVTTGPTTVDFSFPPIRTGVIGEDEANAGVRVPGRADPGSTVSMKRVEDNVSLGTTTANSAGDWTFTLSKDAITAYWKATGARAVNFRATEGSNVVTRQIEYHNYRPKYTLTSLPAFDPDATDPITITFTSDAKSFAEPEHTTVQLIVREKGDTSDAQVYRFTYRFTTDNPSGSFEISAFQQRLAAADPDNHEIVGYLRNERYKNATTFVLPVPVKGAVPEPGAGGRPAGWGTHGTATIPPVGRGALGSWSEPGVRQSTIYKGRKITKLDAGSTAGDACYSKYTCMNANETLVKSKNGRIYTPSGAYVGRIPGNEESRWSYNDPNIMFYTQANRLMEYNVSAASSVTLFTTPGNSEKVHFSYEGNQSGDDKLFAVCTGNTSTGMARAWVWHRDRGYLGTKSVGEIVSILNSLPIHDASFKHLDSVNVSMGGRIIAGFTQGPILVLDERLSNGFVLGKNVGGKVYRVRSSHGVSILSKGGEDTYAVTHSDGFGIIDLAKPQEVNYYKTGVQENAGHISHAPQVPGMVALTGRRGGSAIRGFLTDFDHFDNAPNSTTDRKWISDHKRLEVGTSYDRAYCSTNDVSGGTYPEPQGSLSPTGRYATFNRHDGSRRNQKIMMCDVRP